MLEWVPISFSALKFSYRNTEMLVSSPAKVITIICVTVLRLLLVVKC